MRNFDSATAAYFAGQTTIVARLLIWITAKDRSTGASHSIGIWNGDDHTDFAINGGTRTYYGAGPVLQLPVITYVTGFSVQAHTVELASLAPEIVSATRVYDARFAPVEIHRALFDPVDMSLVAEPHRVFKGWIDAAPLPTPEIGGETKVSLTLMSSARALTRSVSQMKSDATQQLRSGDRFRRWNTLSGAIDVAWGETRVTGS